MIQMAILKMMRVMVKIRMTKSTLFNFYNSLYVFAMLCAYPVC